MARLTDKELELMIELVKKIPATVAPLPAEGESSPKPEAELWRDRVKILSSIADEQTCGCCERIVRTARKWFAESKPEAGEPKVMPWPEDLTTLIGKRITMSMRDRDYPAFSGVVSACEGTAFWFKDDQFGRWTAHFHLLSVEEVHPQPAADKGAERVLPDAAEFVAHLERASEIVKTWPEWKQSLLGSHPPQPSEQAKGAEWLPEGMKDVYASYPTLTFAWVQRIEARDTQWRTFIESERAQHKAEMEAVRKGASR